MALLTDRTLAQSSAITPTTLIHIVTTGDTSQNPAGSSYKAELGQLIPIFSGTPDIYITGGTYSANTITFINSTGGTFDVTGITFNFTGGSSNCITDFYVTNVYGCSPITIHDEVQSFGSTALGTLSFAFGTGNTTSGNYSHAEGSGNGALGNFSHSEGSGNQSIGVGSHSEGDSTNAIGDYSHTEGRGNVTTGNYSHAEGFYTKSSGEGSHSEGSGTTAYGDYSHAEGISTSAMTLGSHTQGLGTITGADYQLACGQYNFALDNQSAFMVGNGSDDLNRSNVLTAYGTTVNVLGDLFVTGSTNIGTQIVFTTTGITTSTFIITYDKTYWGVNYNGNVDLTLPDPTSYDGRNFFIKDEGGYAGTYRIRLTTSGGLIDGNPYVDMNINYMSLHLVARNNNWWII